MGRFRYHGDKNAGPGYRKYGWDMLAFNRQTMRNLGIDQAQSTKRLDDGVIIKAVSQMFMDTVDICVPEPVLKEQVLPEAAHIPGCVARYGWAENNGNEITLGDFAGYGMTNLSGNAVVDLEEDGDLFMPSLPDAGLERIFRRVRMPGPENYNSGAAVSHGHIPTEGSYTVSTVVRLREALEFPYYDALNGRYVPIKPWYLRGSPGAWTRDRGGFCPIMGYAFPQYGSTFHEGGNTWALEIESPLAGEPEIHPDPEFPFPWGFMMGLKTSGIFLYGGNRILAGKQAFYETDYANLPIISPELQTGRDYHVAMSFDAEEGIMRLLLSWKEDGAVNYHYAEQVQTDKALYPDTGEASDLSFWNAAGDAHLGLLGYWGLDFSFIRSFPWGESESFSYGDFTVEESAAIDVALPRFYHYALSREAMYFLSHEVFQGVFVVDDEELPFAQGAGLRVFSFPGEMIE